MLLEEAIRAHLVANGGVSALIGTRLYPLVLPQDPTYPAIVLTRVSGVREHSHDGPSLLSTSRLQLDCIAPTAAAAKNVADKVRLALDGFRGTMGGAGGVEVNGAWLEDERDGYDDELRVYSASVDYMVLHNEASS